jgi:hypothetical protein
LIRLKNRIHLRFDDFGIVEFVKISNIFFLLLAYAVLLLGIFGSILIIFVPTIDDVFLRNTLNYISTKYQSFDENQKNEIRKIFRDIFVETNTAQIVNADR